MKRFTFLTTATLGLVLLVAPMLQAGEETAKGDDAEKVRVAATIKRLGSDDFATRDKAFNELAKLGEAIRPALEAALKSDDLQVRVSAERLLAKLTDKGSTTKGSAPERGPDEVARRRALEALMERLAEMGGGPASPEDLEKLRRALSERTRDMDARMRAIEAEVARAIGDPRVGAGGGRSTGRVVVRTNDETTMYEQLADGRVRIEITKPGAGEKPETTKYEVASLDELKKKHPTVYERVKGFTSDGGAVRVRIGTFGGPAGGHTFTWPRFRKAPSGTARSTNALGVVVRSPSPVLRAQLGLDAGKGLVIDAVGPESIAKRCGVQVHDVLLAIDGRKVAVATDVGLILSERTAPDTPVRLQVVRRGKTLELIETK